MSSNPHVATAKFLQNGVHDWQSDWGSTDATNLAAMLDAQTEATLALAYEQRTTALAILILANRGGDGVLEQAREIEARLGMEQRP